MAGGAKMTRHAWRVVAVVAVLAIVSNLALILAAKDRGSQKVFTAQPAAFDEPILMATSLGGDRLALVTMDNALVVTEKGRRLALVTPEYAVGGLLYLPEKKRIVIGTADGVVSLYDKDLEPIAQTDLGKGRILGLARAENGGLVVATGVTTYGERFFVSRLDQDCNLLGTYQLGKPIESIGCLNAVALAGDDTAWVTAISASGERLWETQLLRDVSVLCGWQQRGTVLAGDLLGNTYQLDGANGRVLWQQHISQWRIEVIQPLGQELVAFGDRDGNLFLLDSGGQTLLTSRAQDNRIVAVAALDREHALAIRRSGQTVEIDAGALQGARLLETLRPFWYALNGLWLLLLLGALVCAIERWRRAAARLRHELRRSALGYLFLLPSAIAILIFTYLPAGMAVYYSLTDYVPGAPVRYVGLQNFITILTNDRYFWLGVGNMLLLMVTSVLKTLTMPLLAALLVFHLRRQSVARVFRTVILIPSVVPGIVAVLIWKMMYSPGDTGFINSILQAVGMGNLQRAWLGDERIALWAIIFSGFPWVGAFGFLIYLGGLINMNAELLDAAAIDGVNGWGRLRHIEWPLLAPQRNLLLFFTFLGSIQDYTGIYVFTQGGPGHATYVPALQLFLRLSNGMEVGYASAIGFVLLLAVLAITIIQRRMQREDVTI